MTGTGLPTGALDAAGYGHADSAVGADTTETPDGADTADRVDIGWGDGKKAAPAPSEYDGSILYGGLGDGFQGTLTEPAEVAEPAVVPGTAPTRTGYLITGQLSLISLLLGLGIAALRIRRRWNVV